jgi:hypothetical protein
MPTGARRTESHGKAVAVLSPREAADSTVRDIGPASTGIVGSFVWDRIWTGPSFGMWAVSQSMSRYSDAAAAPYRAVPASS